MPAAIAEGRLRSGTDVGSVRAAFCRTNHIGSCENLQKKRPRMIPWSLLKAGVVAGVASSRISQGNSHCRTIGVY